MTLPFVGNSRTATGAAATFGYIFYTGSLGSHTWTDASGFRFYGETPTHYSAVNMTTRLSYVVVANGNTLTIKKDGVAIATLTVTLTDGNITAISGCDNPQIEYNHKVFTFTLGGETIKVSAVAQSVHRDYYRNPISSATYHYYTTSISSTTTNIA